MVYYLCGVNGCEHKTKQPSNVKIHEAIIQVFDVTTLEQSYCPDNDIECSRVVELVTKEVGLFGV